jgi:hypothetical protein
LRELPPKSRGIITTGQKEILKVLNEVPDAEHFYLTGGTALSEFYLGHRLSYDLDIFTNEDGLVGIFTRSVERRFQEVSFDFDVLRRFENFVEMVVKSSDESVRIHFGYDTPYRFGEPISMELFKVNDYIDLVVDKFLAYYGRAEPRDAIDLYFILENENFYEIAELAKKKDPGFDPYWMAVALRKSESFPDEIERWPVDMLISVDVKSLKEKFVEIAIGILERIRKKEI